MGLKAIRIDFQLYHTSNVGSTGITLMPCPKAPAGPFHDKESSFFRSRGVPCSVSCRGQLEGDIFGTVARLYFVLVPIDVSRAQ